MKIKTVLPIAAFCAAFAIALVCVTFFNGKNHHSNNQQTQEKIFQFMSKDRAIIREMNEKSNTAKQGERLEIWKHYKELQFKLDTADLPEDFRNAWEKRVFYEVEYINIFAYFRQTNSKNVLKSDAQKEIFEKTDVDYRRACREFDLILTQYGIDYDKNGDVIKK